MNHGYIVDTLNMELPCVAVQNYSYVFFMMEWARAAAALEHIAL